MTSSGRLVNQRASCSANVEGSKATTGTCICSPGYCADTDMVCHSGTNSEVDQVFTIKVKGSAAGEVLYMTEDGKVYLGRPKNPRAAQWRISVTKAGVKMLWTEAYKEFV